MYLWALIFGGGKFRDCKSTTKITKIGTPRKLPAIRYIAGNFRGFRGLAAIRENWTPRKFPAIYMRYIYIYTRYGYTPIARDVTGRARAVGRPGMAAANQSVLRIIT
jgi:hypothetical protein